VLRINAAATPEHDEDVALLTDLPLRRIMLAKAESPAPVAALENHEVVVLVESPLGIERVGELVRAPNVVGVMWGADDLVAGLGDQQREVAVGLHRLHAALQPVDEPVLVRDLELVRADRHVEPSRIAPRPGHGRGVLPPRFAHLHPGMLSALGEVRAVRPYAA
jgi:hypothetical protein